MTITKKHVRLAIISILLILIGYFIWIVRNGLYPFILGLFLAYLLNPPVCYLESKGIKRVWSIILVYFILFSTIIIGGSKLIPLLIRQLENLGNELPQMAAKVEELIHMAQSQYQNSALPYSMRVALDHSLIGIENNIQQFVAAVAQGIINTISHSIGLAISPVLAFYLLHDWYQIKDELLLLLPGRWRAEIILVFKDINKVLSGVIRGQLTVALIVGILVSCGLYLLNLKYALIIGMLAGMLDIIPYFGAIIGATPAVTLALLYSPWLALKVMILFIFVHQLEGTIIQPKILGDNAGLHPLSVIFFVFIGGELGGLLGMVLGVPIAAIVKVIVRHLLKVLV